MRFCNGRLVAIGEIAALPNGRRTQQKETDRLGFVGACIAVACTTFQHSSNFRWFQVVLSPTPPFRLAPLSGVLTHGLSDFWGVTSGTFANIQNAKSHNVSVQPIHKNGLPDLWATSTHQFLDHQKSIKPYNFVIASDDSFHQNIADVYGTPSEIIIIDGSKNKLLLHWKKANFSTSSWINFFFRK